MCFDGIIGIDLLVYLIIGEIQARLENGQQASGALLHSYK